MSCCVWREQRIRGPDAVVEDIIADSQTRGSRDMRVADPEMLIVEDLSDCAFDLSNRHVVKSLGCHVELELLKFNLISLRENQW